MECARYPDFISICTFVQAFGYKITKNPEHFPCYSVYQIKQWLESDRRQSQSRIRTLLRALVDNIDVKGKYKHITDREFDNILSHFLMKHGESKSAEIVENCGFENLRIRRKLAVLRSLMEVQLTHNPHIEGFCRMHGAKVLRLEPIGRDVTGSVYWKFVDRDGGGHWTIVKEMSDDNQQPMCEYIRTRADLNAVVATIKSRDGVKRYCGGDACLLKMIKSPSIACSQCKKKWHEACVDVLPHFDSEWQCPKCDEKLLIQNLRSMCE